MPLNRSERGTDYEAGEMVYPKTLEGQGISPTNECAGLVCLEIARTGQDPLEGTGLTYGEHLVYDVSPSAPVASSPGSPGTPAKANEVPYSPGNPYEGKGKF